MANYRMTPGRRAALKKAQLASARKRKGRGKKYAKGAAIVVGVAAAGYATHVVAKESALKKKHGKEYVKKYGSYYHFTKNNSARKLVKTKTWKPTGKNGGHGSKNGVWLTSSKKDRDARDAFGHGHVKVRLTRGQVMKYRTHSIPGGMDPSRKGPLHVQISADYMNGRKLSHNLAKSSRGVRARHKQTHVLHSASYNSWSKKNGAASANRYVGRKPGSLKLTAGQAYSPIRSKVRRIRKKT